MNKNFFKIGLGMLALAGMVWSSSGAVTGTKTLTGHVPAAVSHLAAAGRLSSTNSLYLSIGLPLHNREALTNLLNQIYDPSSPNYHHYLSPDEFTAQFGPTPEDYQAVLDFAQANGLTVAHTHGNRMVVDVVGQVPNVEQAFHIKMMKYHHPIESRDFYAPDSEPSVDANLPILAVQGMNNYVLPHPMLLKRPVSAYSPAIGSSPFGGYMGQDFRNAYLPGSTLNGSGQTVGLLQFDGYFPTDIQAYETIAGLTNVPLQNVLLDGFNGAPGFNNDEVCLDIEMSISMAPALAQVVVFEAGPFGNPDDILSSMASSNQIKQLSSSWGYATDATSDQFYLQFALQGQTYLNCSGDGDAWVGAIPYGSVEDPNVTVVGGTTLFMTNKGGAYVSERAWNAGNVGDFNWNTNGYAGTSGGISTDVPIPFYQLGINMVTNLGSATFRNLPDVALTADNVFVVSSGGREGIFGGTSAATPLWAGFMALVNQQATANNLPPIGFLAPAVYGIAKTNQVMFHDITAGDNTWNLSTNQFFAVPGYDLCTGLGTPNGTNMINALTGTNSIPIVYAPVIPAPKQPWGASLTNMVGTDPNGLWLLFMQDDTMNGYSGTNYNGWAVNLTTANPVGHAADNQLFINANNFVVPVKGTWITVLSVTNYGPSSSTNVVVTDLLPPLNYVGLSSYSSSIPSSSFSKFADLLTWNVGNLATNGGGTLTLYFTNVSPTVGIFTNGAVVTADTADPNPDDDSVGANIYIGTPGPVITPHFVLGGGSGGVLQLNVTNYSGVTMVIQASTNLTTWVSISTNISPFTFSTSDTTNFPKRFYRASVTTP